MNYPNWVRADRVLLRAEWDGRASDVSRLIRSWAEHLSAIDAALGDRRPWKLEGSGDLDEFDLGILEELLIARVERDDDGTEWPTLGYNVIMNRGGDRGFVSLLLRVGATVPGRRRPSNSIFATVVGPTVDGSPRAVSVQLVEAVLSGTVHAWDPDSAAALDRAASRAAEGAAKFAPVVGQRTWVSDRLGTVDGVTSGVNQTTADRGTYLFADDSLDSASAVQEIRATLEANGITEIPRAVG